MIDDRKYIGVISRNNESRKKLLDRIDLVFMNSGFLKNERPDKVINYDGEVFLLKRDYRGLENRYRASVIYIPTNVQLDDGFTPDVPLREIRFSEWTVSGLCDALVRFSRETPKLIKAGFYFDLTEKSFKKVGSIEKVLPKDTIAKKKR